jgi:preprotein translocase subunit SecD
MKTLAEILRDADPLAYEAPRSPQERRARRQMILDAAHVGDHAAHWPFAPAAIVALAIVGIVLSVFHWSRTSVDVIAAVRFEVRLAEENPAPGLREAVIVGTGRKIYLHPEPVVVNSDIAHAELVLGDSASTFGVSLTFNADGVARMLRATQSHVGRPLAILIDGEVVTAPVVRSPITTAAVITGDYTRADAERIVSGIVGR